MLYLLNITLLSSRLRCQQLTHEVVVVNIPCCSWRCDYVRGQSELICCSHSAGSADLDGIFFRWHLGWCVFLVELLNVRFWSVLLCRPAYQHPSDWSLSFFIWSLDRLGAVLDWLSQGSLYTIINSTIPYHYQSSYVGCFWMLITVTV